MSHPLYAYTTIARPFEVVAAAVANEPASVFVDTAVPGQTSVLVDLHADLAGASLTRHVVIELGTPRPRGTHDLVVPITWRAAAHPGVFPVAVATLEITALSHRPPATQLTLAGTYEVPLGLLGDAADRLVGESVVAASLDDLLERIAQRLTASTADPVEAPRPSLI